MAPELSGNIAYTKNDPGLEDEYGLRKLKKL